MRGSSAIACRGLFSVGARPRAPASYREEERGNYSSHRSFPRAYALGYALRRAVGAQKMYSKLVNSYHEPITPALLPALSPLLWERVRCEWETSRHSSTILTTHEIRESPKGDSDHAGGLRCALSPPYIFEPTLQLLLKAGATMSPRSYFIAWAFRGRRTQSRAI